MLSFLYQVLEYRSNINMQKSYQRLCHFRKTVPYVTFFRLFLPNIWYTQNRIGDFFSCIDRVLDYFIYTVITFNRKKIIKRYQCYHSLGRLSANDPGIQLTFWKISFRPISQSSQIPC